MSNGRVLAKSKRTRTAILDAAEDLFSEFGFDGASLDAIGERAGIQGTAILYHFPSKRALYEAVLDRLFSPLLAELKRTLGSAEPVDARLAAAVEAIVGYAAEHPNAPRLLIRETAAASTDAREIIEARAATATAKVIDAFAAQSEDPNVDPVVVVNIIVGAVCFYFVGPPGLGGEASYDPRDPQLVAAFAVTMRDLTRSLLHLGW
jgi:TetR/AcrR family transcriptional regulator